MISEKNINGVKLWFDHEQYTKVRQFHELKNKIVINAEWNHYYHEGNQIIEHPLLYKVIRDKKTKKLYIVTKVLRQFFAGFHIVLQYDDKNGSSGIAHLDYGKSIALTTKPDFNTRFELTTLTLEQFFEDCGDAVNAYGEKSREWFYYHTELNKKVLNHFSECD
jgi:hypothetical protein